MPAMPAWAEGARIIYDKEYNLAFVRRGRRGPWRPYTVYRTRLIAIEGGSSHQKLEAAREAILTLVGRSIGAMVLDLHPGARQVHLQNPAYARLKGQPYHICGAPADFKTGYQLSDLTCPICIAVMAEDIANKAREVGHEAVEAARETVRTVREINAMGKIVTGDSAVDEM